jgi:diaminopimelate decarboxylase
MVDLLAYEPPRLDPLTFTAVSKHLTGDVLPGSAFDEHYDVSQLMAAYGSPLFVVSESMLRQLYRGFRNSFSSDGIDTKVAYSYKTNYLPAICAILHDEGAWAEVVSGMEYNLARALEVPANEIIFNGPYKSRQELETAFGQGALVNLDNIDELELAGVIARDLGHECRIGLRVNFKFGLSPWTKFGFNEENGDAQLALERIAASPNLNLELLHNHSGTFLLNHDTYAKATEVLIGVARRARALNLKPTMIDLGGGYPSGNRLKPEFDLPETSRRKQNMLYPYAEAILKPLREAKELFGGRPTLVLEPGRALIDSAVQLACTVVGSKIVPGHGKAVIVDAGVNLVPTAYWYDHNVDTVVDSDDGENKLETVNIYGPLCMQIDVLRERALLPPLQSGDPLVISNVGAYCQTQSMQFIQPRPATVLLGPEGAEVIRRKETWQDIFSLDQIPSRLRPDGFSL